MRRLAFTLAMCLSLSACAPNYSNGTRVGVVTKLAKKGIIWKSYEGELVQSGRVVIGNQDAAVFKFSVCDEVVAAKMLDAANRGEIVSLVYRQWLVSPPTQDSVYTIVDIKAAK